MTARWLLAAALGLFPARAAAAAPAFTDLPFAAALGALRDSALTAARTGVAAVSEDRAYDLVSARLRGTGVPESYVRGLFLDSRLALETGVVDRWNRPSGSMSYERYRRIFITPERIAAGKAFYADNRALVDATASSYGVDPLVLVSLVGVETYFGRHLGAFTVFNALYTAIHKVPRKEAFAVRELAAFVTYSFQDGIDAHAVMGSFAGAFGFGQFIPSSFNSYAVDADGDGVRSPYRWPDALASVANYLTRNGYRRGETDYSRGGSVWTALYAYNHSENYVKVILELREEIMKVLPQPEA